VPVRVLGLSGHARILERGTGDVVNRPHEPAPLNETSQPNRVCQYTDHDFPLANNPGCRKDSGKKNSLPVHALSQTALISAKSLRYNAPLGKEESMSKMMKIELSMYGIAEVLHWCHDRNKGRVPGVDTAGFDKMKVLLAEKPQSGDYFTLDQFWKKRVTLDLTEDEVATIDRCLYDIPNFDSEPLPQIRHKFWPQQTAAH
jgi:hypothetical protein